MRRVKIQPFPISSFQGRKQACHYHLGFCQIGAKTILPILSVWRQTADTSHPFKMFVTLYFWWKILPCHKEHQYSIKYLFSKSAKTRNYKYSIFQCSTWLWICKIQPCDYLILINDSIGEGEKNQLLSHHSSSKSSASGFTRIWDCASLVTTWLVYTTVKYTQDKSHKLTATISYLRSLSTFKNQSFKMVIT